LIQRETAEQRGENAKTHVSSFLGRVSNGNGAAERLRVYPEFPV